MELGPAHIHSIGISGKPTVKILKSLSDATTGCVRSEVSYGCADRSPQTPRAGATNVTNLGLEYRSWNGTERSQLQSDTVVPSTDIGFLDPISKPQNTM